MGDVKVIKEKKLVEGAHVTAGNIIFALYIYIYYKAYP